MPLVKIYHVTDQESAENIMREGFRDPIDPWRSIQQLLPYPFFSDQPIDKVAGAKGNTVIEIIIETTPEEMFEQFDTRLGKSKHSCCDWGLRLHRKPFFKKASEPHR